MPDLRANLRFVAKVVLATLLLGVLAGVAGSQIVPGWSLVRVLLSSALGAAVLVTALVVADRLAGVGAVHPAQRRHGCAVVVVPWRSAGSGGLAPPGARPEKNPAGPTALSGKLTARCLERDGRSFLVEKWTKIALFHRLMVICCYQYRI